MPLLLDRLLGRNKSYKSTIDGDPKHGLFQNADNTVFNEAVSMVGHKTIVHDWSMTIIDKMMNNIQYIDQGKPVLEALACAMTPGADVDSSARYPPPKCYPGTRESLTNKAREWLFNDQRAWDILWLHGPAGVGKSAVAQTLAEYAVERNRLGAVFFFSKTARRNNPQSVFITLAYQLAVRIPAYLPCVARQLARDPDLLTKAPHVQFKRLIVEPLGSIPSRPKYLVILDGLDECDGEHAQLDIVELINNLILSQTSTPIIWMVCSRPEPYLMQALHRPDFAIMCWREQLEIKESCADTALFIRTRFKEIHEQYGDCVEAASDGLWPPENDVTCIIGMASGLFILASTILKYIEDPELGQPNARLADVLGVIRHSNIVGDRGPMDRLDLLYTRILSEVPDSTWQVTHRLLHFICHIPRFWKFFKLTPVCISNFLGITRSDFYTALRKLHSVLDIPPSDAAHKDPLRFYHASFPEYLHQPARSGRFCVKLTSNSLTSTGLESGLRVMGSVLTFLDLSSRCLDSLEQEHPTPQMTESQVGYMLAKHLTWPALGPEVNRACAQVVVAAAVLFVFAYYPRHLTHDGCYDGLDSLLRAFDYSACCFLPRSNRNSILVSIIDFIRWLKASSLRDLVRTHSLNEVDDRLLGFLTTLEANSEPLDLNRIATSGYLSFRHLSKQTDQVYFLLGYGQNTVLALVTRQRSPIKFYSPKTAIEIWPCLAG